jgi:predicted Fe-Mo cluster-binding NifX family protein
MKKEKQEAKKSIKIAISSIENDLEGDMDASFGRCPYFLIVEIKEDKIKHVKAIENTAAAQAGGAGISAAQLVADQEVEAVITANIGPRAFDVFNQLDIKIYIAQGKVKDVIHEFIDGELEQIESPTGQQHMGMGMGAGRGQGRGIGRRFQQ